MYTGDFRLFATIEANDIKQGLLGDCWLMCSLSAAAEFPKIIEQAFVGENDSFSKFGRENMNILCLCMFAFYFVFADT